LEWHHELRRHAGDERLPPDLRVHLRERAQRALARLTAAMPTPVPRRQLRDAAPVLLAPELRDVAVSAAAALGVDLQTRFVAVAVRRNPAAIVSAIDWLVTQGYTVLRIGDVSDPIRRRGVVDVRATSHADLVDRVVIEKASFVVCDSGERQQAAVLANTPSLRLNARDPFSAYPVRGNDIFTLADIVDLDSGRVLPANELLSETYLRHVRGYGVRPNRAEHVLAAVQEIHEGVTAGWREDAQQMRVRERVTEAGVALASRVPLVAEWGPDEGFLGDGRLARWQAGQIL
jgi:putative glycosyltransferase (TIGR04372 family)